MKGTLRHQIFENFDVAVGSGGVPDMWDFHQEDSEMTISQGPHLHRCVREWVRGIWG